MTFQPKFRNGYENRNRKCLVLQLPQSCHEGMVAFGERTPTDSCFPRPWANQDVRPAVDWSPRLSVRRLRPQNYLLCSTQNIDNPPGLMKLITLSKMLSQTFIAITRMGFWWPEGIIGCLRRSVAQSSIIKGDPVARGLFNTRPLSEYWPKSKLRNSFQFFPRLAFSVRMTFRSDAQIRESNDWEDNRPLSPHKGDAIRWHPERSCAHKIWTLLLRNHLWSEIKVDYNSRSCWWSFTLYCSNRAYCLVNPIKCCISSLFW
jgi:hypothetical protein